ncbi:hypothetical protein ACLOJK_010011 [Asimina triloba]
MNVATDGDTPPLFLSPVRNTAEKTDEKQRNSTPEEPQMGNCNGLLSDGDGRHHRPSPQVVVVEQDGAPGGARRPQPHATANDNASHPNPARPSQPHSHPQPAKPFPSPAAVPRPLAGIGRVLGRPMEDVRSTYIIGRELGRGQFGVTYLCTHRETKEVFACKSIATRKLVNRDDVEDVRREVQIMHHLTGHRNIVELKGAYEDRHSVNLVMELCAGGELFDRIIAKGHYSERAAAALCREIVTVVHYCDTMGVMHRDLKPENFLFLSTDEDSPLKATDFGLSVFFKPGNPAACSLTLECSSPLCTDFSLFSNFIEQL